MLTDAQLMGEFLGVLGVRVSENGQSLHIPDVDGDRELAGRTQASRADEHDIKVVPPPAGLS